MSLRTGLNALPRQRWGWAAAELDEGRVHLDLAVGALWRARGDQRGRILLCQRGVVWITQERDVSDYLLQAGEAFIVTLPGLVLATALEPASVTVVTPGIRASRYAGAYPPFHYSNFRLNVPFGQG
jgi:hypothetical protein